MSIRLVYPPSTGGGGGGGGGGVTSVGLVDQDTTNLLKVANSPIVGSGNIGLSFQPTSSNFFLAGPASSGAVPAFRAVVGADIPAINLATSANGGVTGTLPGANQAAANLASTGNGGVTGTVPVANGGTSLATLTANNVILGNGTGSPIFIAPGTAGNVLTSTGSTWASSAATGGGGGGSGTVTSVSLVDQDTTNLLNITNSPITVSGAIGLSFQPTSANYFLAGPASSGAVPSFRPISVLDLPSSAAYDMLSRAKAPDASSANANWIMASTGQWYFFTSTTTNGSAPWTITLPTASLMGTNVRPFVGVMIDPDSTQLVQLQSNNGGVIGPLIGGLGTSAHTMWAGESAILSSNGSGWVKTAGLTVPMSCSLGLQTDQRLVAGTVTRTHLDNIIVDNTGLMATTAGGNFNVTFQRSGNYIGTGFITYDPGTPNNLGGNWPQNFGAYNYFANNQAAGNAVFGYGKQTILGGSPFQYNVNNTLALSGNRGQYIAMDAELGGSSGTVVGAISQGSLATGFSVIEIPQW